MITKEQAINENMFHWMQDNGHCDKWRRNGQTKTWKSEANAHKFEVPVKYGLYRYGRIDQEDAKNPKWHTQVDCPNGVW